MDEVVSLQKVTACDKRGRKEQEPQYPKKISYGASLIDHSGLNAKDIYAIQDGMNRLAGLAKCNDVNGVTTLDQGAGVLLNARVRLVKRVREHTDLLWFVVRTCVIGHMTGKNAPR
jgi:hypothetical protein